MWVDIVNMQLGETGWVHWAESLWLNKTLVNTAVDLRVP